MLDKMTFYCFFHLIKRKVSAYFERNNECTCASQVQFLILRKLLQSKTLCSNRDMLERDGGREEEKEKQVQKRNKIDTWI